MKDFHHSYTCRPTDNGKREQKKSHSYHCNMCKCVKLHYQYCPMVMQPCPLHGSQFYTEDKIEKGDRGQNVIISFHPSSKTERLLQPIKSLLANCKSETKINFRYYSPTSSISSESIRHNYGRNALENLKKNFNNNLLIDRTKSFVVDKTSKVKKLKQCFYSPCGSIARKSRSQASIKEKLNQALLEEAKQKENSLYKLMSELPCNDKRNDWFTTRRVSNEKFYSDFITVTKHDKNNIISHKIFEIQHEPDGKEIPYVGFPKQQNQFVYAAAKVNDEPVSQKEKKKPFKFRRKKSKKTEDPPPPPLMFKRTPSDNIPPPPNKIPPEQIPAPPKKSTSEHTPTPRSSMESSSSGSVYITPFFFIPKTIESKESEEIEKEEEEKPLSVNAAEPDEETFQMVGTQTSIGEIDKTGSLTKTHTNATTEPKERTVFTQTDIISEESIPARSTVQKTVIEETYIERFLKPSDYSPSRHSAPSSSRKSKQSHYTSTAEEQVNDGYELKEISIKASWKEGMKDQISQTDELWSFNLKVKTFESRTNKSQGTSPRYSERGLQTITYQTPSSKPSEFISLKAPHVTYVDQSPDSDDSVEKIEKSWMVKSHSVNDLVKCSCCKSQSSKAVGVESEKSQNPPGNRNVKGSCTIEETSLPVSDLTELKKYIHDLFEKENVSKKSCECVKSRTPKTEVPRKQLVDAEIQTIRILVVEKTQNVEIQTTRSLAAEKTQTVEIQTSRSLAGDKKRNAEAQTDICVLLEEMEQDEQEQDSKSKKIKVCRTVILDNENQSKTFFICALCGRDMTFSKNVATSTIAPTKKTQKTVVTDREVTKWTEAHVQIKNIRNPPNDNSKTVTREQDNDKTKGYKNTRPTKPQAVPRKSTIPPGAPSEPARTRNENRKSQINSGPEQKGNGPTESKIHKCALPMRDCECECECENATTSYVTQPSTKGYLDQSSPKHSKEKDTRSTPDDQRGRQDTEQDKKRRRYRIRSTEYLYPVITSRLWPEDFLQSWESLENSMEKSGDFALGDVDLKLQNQKRTFEKDLDSTTLGKRIKVEVVEKAAFTNPSPTVSGLLIKGEDGDYKFWPSNLVECPSATQNEKGTIVEISKMDDDTWLFEDDFSESFLDHGQFSDGITASRSSLLPETEDKEVGESTEEVNVFSFPIGSDVLPQTHSVFNFSSFPDSNADSNSKSFNTFWFFKESKKK